MKFPKSKPEQQNSWEWSEVVLPEEVIDELVSAGFKIIDEKKVETDSEADDLRDILLRKGKKHVSEKERQRMKMEKIYSALLEKKGNLIKVVPQYRNTYIKDLSEED